MKIFASESTEAFIRETQLPTAQNNLLISVAKQEVI